MTIYAIYSSAGWWCHLLYSSICSGWLVWQLSLELGCEGNTILCQKLCFLVVPARQMNAFLHKQNATMDKGSTRVTTVRARLKVCLFDWVSRCKAKNVVLLNFRAHNLIAADQQDTLLLHCLNSFHSLNACPILDDDIWAIGIYKRRAPKCMCLETMTGCRAWWTKSRRGMQGGCLFCYFSSFSV